MGDAVSPFIAARAEPYYVGRSMPRLLSSLLLVLALLLSPLAMIGGAGQAHAAAPPAAMASGHCSQTAPASEHEKRAPGMELGCAISCAAVPATDPCTAECLPHAAMPPVRLGHQLLPGIHPEGETPPPRNRPEI